MSQHSLAWGCDRGRQSIITETCDRIVIVNWLFWWGVGGRCVRAIAELTAAVGSEPSLVGRWAVTCNCKSCVSSAVFQQGSFPTLEILKARPQCFLLEAISISNKELQKNFLTKSYCKKPLLTYYRKISPISRSKKYCVYWHICLLPLFYKTFLTLMILFWGRRGVMAVYSDDAKKPRIT